jgi:hypothetical protein
MLNRSKTELLGRAAADVAKTATEVLALNAKMRYAETQVIADDWHPSAVTRAREDLDAAESMLRGQVEVLKLQIAGLE